MTISVFDLFKIGIGPSSSHTVGPMKAANRFVSELPDPNAVSRIEITLYGSLSSTGIGHGTDQAVVAGLMGMQPELTSPDDYHTGVDKVRESGQLPLLGGKTISFDISQDIKFAEESLPFHPNGIRLTAYHHDQEISSAVFYSVGGGFIVSEADALAADSQTEAPSRYEFSNAEQLLDLCRQHDMSISELVMANETDKGSETFITEDQVRQKLTGIWQAMDQCIQTGIQGDGILPGGLGVKRRAHKFFDTLNNQVSDNLIASSLKAMDWVNLYAMAVNEENAAGGRVVTAPTNGAAGIIPAVLKFYDQFSEDADQNSCVRFLLTAGAIGIVIKKNASISGAEVGCQGEVGSACAMAAAGLVEVMGGSPAQIANAAEIALEHNLGLTCDPIGGLVQVPCIERNAIAAVKAINAAQLALRGDGQHFVSLDKVIATMRETGRDMASKYKETSTGGLAVNLTEC